MKSITLILLIILITFAASQSGRTEEMSGGLSRVEDFLGIQAPVATLDEIEQRGLLSAKTAVQPWSGSAWTDIHGSIADPYFSGGTWWPTSWSNNREYIVRQDRQEKLRKLALMSSEQLWSLRRDQRLDLMLFLDSASPAEKYDLLLGNSDLPLSSAVIAMIDQFSQSGQTALWTGICHGWSPAALTLSRPEKAITLQSPSGLEIQFYPTDIKALASFLWAKSFAQNYVEIEGTRCFGQIARNEYGRIIDPSCFDVNPAFLHLALVNQIGVKKRGLIIDRNYGAEVFNQPAFGYTFNYFNPITGRKVSHSHLAQVPLNAESTDLFSQYRSPKAVALIGVNLKLSYINEGKPNHAVTDAPASDSVEYLELQYDLELDSRGVIVGGEWRDYTNAQRRTGSVVGGHVHPDILWVVPQDLKAWSIADTNDLLEQTPWGGEGPLPSAWREAALKAANARALDQNNQPTIIQPQPLAHVIDVLLRRSSSH